jgi:hypothetical protein
LNVLQLNPLKVPISTTDTGPNLTLTAFWLVSCLYFALQSVRLTADLSVGSSLIVAVPVTWTENRRPQKRGKECPQIENGTAKHLGRLTGKSGLIVKFQIMLQVLEHYQSNRLHILRL